MKKVYCLEFGELTLNGKPLPGMILVEADSPEEARKGYTGNEKITGIRPATEKEIIWAHSLKIIADKHFRNETNSEE